MRASDKCAQVYFEERVLRALLQQTSLGEQAQHARLLLEHELLHVHTTTGTTVPRPRNEICCDLRQR
jgi:hypothetical protein